jgi:chromatin remodeling complex protein RSC6
MELILRARSGSRYAENDIEPMGMVGTQAEEAVALTIDEAEVPEPLLRPSDSLAEITGTEPISRTEAIKRVWAYIKANGLQRTDYKTRFDCDERLSAVFGPGPLSMFVLGKLLHQHLFPVSEDSKSS